MFEFVQAKESDRETLLELRKLTMTEHLERSGQFLSPQEHEIRLDEQYQFSYMVFHLQQFIGTIKYRSAIARVELIQIQIDPKYQNKGYGSGIIKQVLDNAKSKTVTLSVLKDNQALSLYNRLGFKTVGEGDYEYHMQFKHSQGQP